MPGIRLLGTDEREREFILCILGSFSSRVPNMEKPPPAINLNYMSSLVFTGEGDKHHCQPAPLALNYQQISSPLQQSTEELKVRPRHKQTQTHCFMRWKSSCYPSLIQRADNRTIHFGKKDYSTNETCGMANKSVIGSDTRYNKVWYVNVGVIACMK